VVNGGLPFDLPALKPFFSGETNYLPSAHDFENLSRLSSMPKLVTGAFKQLIDSVDGLSRDVVDNPAIIPGDALIREFIGGSTIKIPHNE